MGVYSTISVADSGTESITVFAAASTTNALTEIGKIFSEQKKVEFIPSFASSSALAKQIENQAPANIYISANYKWMDYLEEKQMINSSSRFNLLSNRIVLIVPADSSIKKIDIKANFDLSKLLGNGYLSMGDPDHVPAGIYGKQSLENLGVWGSIKNKVARSKDVRTALMLVERGESPVGIVYATDAAITKKVRIAGMFPKESHSPILYPAALVAGRQTPAALDFMKFLKTPEARVIFEKYGFTVLQN
uniref:Molybdate-binding periplasmic protein n=1 Tax=uncultured Desulfobacterium sp. TaxID=201089 RepID=E1YCL4_9BACT|nr:Molybdate-binding periplasmic protein [uncultured Desulfobacterium sp.]